MQLVAPRRLVAAPVELTLDLPAPVLDELFRWAAPRLSGEIGADGIARISLARRKGSGHGYEHGREGLDGYLQLKHLRIRHGA